ncbi:MAG: hypothetical protein GY812_13470 [Actinomycetia bacterium]|nr:hypothetical protein [Actinomycetes bacterium]
MKGIPKAGSTDITRASIRGIVTAISPEDGLEPTQASLVGALAASLFGDTTDVSSLEPISESELADALEDTGAEQRHRIVHLMVLGELILRPIPTVVARRVASYAEALRIEDKYVRIARRYSQGAFGLAWLDLERSGFAAHWEMARTDQLKASVKLAGQLSAGVVDEQLASRWASFAQMPADSLGRSVLDMYEGRGFAIPGSEGGASAYLAQHDFVHVLADYGTNLNGEIETFSLIGRADPDPKGFAWLATLIGLFETGYVADAGFFSGDLEERRLDSTEMHVRLADALRRGAALCDTLGSDLLEIDYHDFVERPLDEVRAELGFPPKSDDAIAAGSPGVFDPAGMSRIQQQYAESMRETNVL